MGRERGMNTRGDLQEDTRPRCTPSPQGSVEFYQGSPDCVPRTFSRCCDFRGGAVPTQDVDSASNMAKCKYVFILEVECQFHGQGGIFCLRVNCTTKDVQ